MIVMESLLLTFEAMICSQHIIVMWPTSSFVGFRQMPSFHRGSMDSDNTMYCVQRYANFHAVALVLHLSIHFHVLSALMHLRVVT